MFREEAIAEIEDELAEIQMRAQGIGDWKGEIDLRAVAERIYETARSADN